MAASRPPNEAISGIYQRLLANEPDAPSDLVELLLEPLVAHLRSEFPQFPDPDLFYDVVTDSLLAFVQVPERYQAEKRSQ